MLPLCSLDAAGSTWCASVSPVHFISWFLITICTYWVHPCQSYPCWIPQKEDQHTEAHQTLQYGPSPHNLQTTDHLPPTLLSFAHHEAPCQHQGARFVQSQHWDPPSLRIESFFNLFSKRINGWFSVGRIFLEESSWKMRSRGCPVSPRCWEWTGKRGLEGQASILL